MHHTDMCSAAGSSRGDTSEAWLEHVGDLLGDFALLCTCSARAASSGSALAISMARLDTERLGGMLRSRLLPLYLAALIRLQNLVLSQNLDVA